MQNPGVRILFIKLIVLPDVVWLSSVGLEIVKNDGLEIEYINSLECFSLSRGYVSFLRKNI